MDPDAFVNKSASGPKCDFNINNLRVCLQFGLSKRIPDEGGTLADIITDCEAGVFQRIKPLKDIKTREQKLITSQWKLKEN